MFNKSSSFTIEQIIEETKLTERTIKALIVHFFNPKCKLFNKASKGKTFDDNELITLNLSFQSNSFRVDYFPKKVKKVQEFSEKDEEAIKNERKHIIDSVIVRIAKARRVIKHNELIAEVIKQVDLFKPQPSLIKLEIESLIQRDFLARDENDRSTYNYIP